MKQVLYLAATGLVLASAGSNPARADTPSLRDAPDVRTEQHAPLSAIETLDDRRPQASAPSLERAVLYSLLLPGLGDYYAGRTYRARAFFVVEAAVWTSFVVFRSQGHLREENYKDFVVRFAGVSSKNHTDDFYKTIGLYDSSDDYEAEFKAEGRFELYPDVGYYALERYYLENRIDDFEEWAWSSSERRIDFREMRSSSRLAYRRSWYMVAAAAANRVMSAISAYQAVKSGSADGNAAGYRLHFGPPGHDVRGEYTAAVTLVRSF
jgi:hypothetical protein